MYKFSESSAKIDHSISGNDSQQANSPVLARLIGLRELVRYAIMWHFFTPKRKSDINAAEAVGLESHHKS